MALRDILEQAKGTTFVDAKGQSHQINLLPPMSEGEICMLETRLNCHVPPDLRELLAFSRGIDEMLDSVEVDFGGNFSFEFELLPHGLPISHDGAGNFWVVDLTRSDKKDTAVFFVCHDPPVVVFQAASIEHFIVNLLEYVKTPEESAISRMQEVSTMHIWQNNPGELTRQECLTRDSELSGFAKSLDDTYQIFDLRKPIPGDGFSWGRYGADTVCKRHGDTRIFACQKKKLGLMQRLFGV